jgi:hypothetical protein
VVEGEGFEPSKAEPSDLQSDPFGHSGTPPHFSLFFYLVPVLSPNARCYFTLLFSCISQFSVANTEPHDRMMVEGEGFEPSKAEPSDLQSDPFGHSGTPPQVMLFFHLFVYH